jgi:predicted ester cyclase
MGCYPDLSNHLLGNLRSRMTSESQNKLLARRFLEEIVNTGAVDRLSDFLAPEYAAPDVGIAGIDQAREHLLTFRHCYPDMVVTVDGQVAEGDIAVTWFIMRATHLVSFGGVQATGKKITLRAVNLQRIRDGRIVEHWGGSNSLEALLELGVVRWASDLGAVSPTAQPGASPNGGPAVPAGDSGVTEGPSSVS